MCVACQGKQKLGLTGPTKGLLENLPEVPDSAEEESDEDSKNGSSRNTVELTQGQQDFYGVS